MKIPEQAMYYVVFFETSYHSLEEALAKASDIIAAHRARSKELHAQGKLLMAGAFLDNNPGKPLGTMGICPTREAAEEFANGDPFVLNGMVSKWYIREWANVFA
jgi:uncharacterized protein YciI